MFDLFESIFYSNFFTSHVIFNCYTYAYRVDQIIFYKSSSFSIHDVAFRSMLPTLQAWRPNTCNNYFEANLTKVGFSIGGHCSIIITNLSHSRWALARTQLATFWSFCLYTAMASPKMLTFIFSMVLMLKTSFKSWRLPRFGLFCHQAMHLFQMLGQQPFNTICDNASGNFTLPFQPNFHPFFVFLSHIRWTRGCRWLRGLVSFMLRT